MGYSNNNYENKLRAIASDKDVASRLAFFGPVPTDEVTLYASSADVGVAPIENVCLSYYYCSPNKLFEYLIAGLPVIASDFPEMRQIIDEYGVGTTFDPSVPEDIARAAMEILKAPEKWEDITKKTDALASTYNWENESRKLIDIYQSLS
jgi:glycosyltransferase involved in cell wall biosynthesis